MRKYDLVLFDMDGTLIDSLDDIMHHVNSAMRAGGYPQHSREEIQSYVGRGVEWLIKCSLPADIDDAAFRHTLHLFSESYTAQSSDAVKVFDGVYETLDRLVQDGYTLCVVSNKPREAVQKIADDCFAGYFGLALGPTSDIAVKPAPDMIHHALTHYACEKRRAVLVGDSDIDVLTAKNAGVDLLAATWGFRSEACLREHGATVLVHSPQDILAAVGTATK